MLNEVTQHLEIILSTYSEGKFYDELIKAKKEYFEITGPSHEEDDDYETRMRCFNDWFIMHYPLVNGETALSDYLSKNKLEDDLTEILKNFSYSVFEFSGKNLSGKLVVKDLLHGEKLIFTEESSMIPVFKGEVFIGRLLQSGSDYHFMKGMCLLPKEGKSIIKKQIKKIKKLSEPENEFSFLLELEYLKTKFLRFGHVDPAKIFVFKS